MDFTWDGLLKRRVHVHRPFCNVNGMSLNIDYLGVTRSYRQKPPRDETHIRKNWTKQSQDVRKMQRSQSCLTLSPRSATSGINVQRRSLHHGTGMVAQLVYSGTGVKCGCLLLAGWASHSSNKIKVYESWMESSCSGRMEKIWNQPVFGFWEVPTFGGWDVNRMCQKMLVSAGQVMPPNQWHYVLQLWVFCGVQHRCWEQLSCRPSFSVSTYTIWLFNIAMENHHFY